MSGIEDQGLRPENVEPAPADETEEHSLSAEEDRTSAEPGSEDGSPAHTSQAEGEDPARTETHPDPSRSGHPSQAEGEDLEDGDE